MMINYEAIEEQNEKVELLLIEQTDEILNFKKKFKDIYLLKANFLKIGTNFQQTLEIHTGMDKLKQIMKSILGGIIFIVEDEIEIHIYRYMYRLTMLVLSFIPFGFIFAGPILFLEEKLLALLKSIIVPIIKKKIPQMLGKFYENFNKLSDQRKYLINPDIIINPQYFLFENIINHKIYNEVEIIQEKKAPNLSKITAKIIRDNYFKILDYETNKEESDDKKEEVLNEKII